MAYIQGDSWNQASLFPDSPEKLILEDHSLSNGCLATLASREVRERRWPWP
jgi:hypothetical protein